MSTIFPVDHHANLRGWGAKNSKPKTNCTEWTSRRRVGFILIASLASWVIVLSPFFLLD